MRGEGDKRKERREADEEWKKREKIKLQERVTVMK